MSAAKRGPTKNGIEHFALRSDGRELPPYVVAVYRDSIIAARRKLDRLDIFALVELRRPQDDKVGDDIDWDFERMQRAKVLNRWLRETKGVIAELMTLFHDLRDDQAILEEFVLERSGRPPG